jgi:hypothetical protein
VAKRGLPAVTICSGAFTKLGRAQASALGYPDLPIAVIPHPFSNRGRDEIRDIAGHCVKEIERLLCDAGAPAAASPRTAADERARLIEAPDEPQALNALYNERRWGDGLPIVPPTARAVDEALRHTRRARDEIVARIAPAFGAATVERIAINAVLAGCEARYLPVLIAAVEAAAAPAFNLQGIQTTTDPVAVWLIVNGPLAERLGINSGANCLGQGTRANATLGRALRLILQNLGGALPGEMDRATQGQPGKYSFCCAENETANPWTPLHVERGYARESSTVTVVGAEGTMNMHSYAKRAEDLLRVFADTMAHGPSNEYVHGGEPWLVLSPEHADILHAAGHSKADVQRLLWEQSKMPAGRMAPEDMGRARASRTAELGDIGAQTLLTIAHKPADIAIIVAGGPGAHSVYVPSFGNTRSVTREIAA